MWSLSSPDKEGPLPYITFLSIWSMWSWLFSVVSYNFLTKFQKSSISNFPPKLVFLYFDSIYPESFRWHTCRENFSKAEACIREIISANATSLPDFTQLYDRAKLAVLNSMYRRPRTFFDLLHTRERIKTTIALVSIW